MNTPADSGGSAAGRAGSGSARSTGPGSARSTGVLVIGAGIIGLSIAWRGAQRGLDVLVVDPAPGAGATQAAAGMLTPIAEAAYAEKELFRLGSESLLRYPAFAAELTELTGQPTGFRQDGTLQVAYDSSDLAVLDELHVLQESFGVPARRLTARECRTAEPMLDPSVRGGLLAERDGSVDPRLLTRALLAAASIAGAGLERQSVTEILIDAGTAAGHATAGHATAGHATAGHATAGHATAGHATAGHGSDAGHGTDAGHAVGVRLADGTEIRADWVVLAAGWQSGTIAGLPDAAAPPVRPVKGQILRLRPTPATLAAGLPPGLLTRTVRGIVRGSSVYLVPRQSGELVIGATQEELGPDTRVTAGGVWELLRDARTLVPGITELELAEAVAGLRPGTPDNAPVLGPSQLPGLVLATGHFRSGVLLAPVTAEIIADYLVTERLADTALPFVPQRFAGRGAKPGPDQGKQGRDGPRPDGSSRTWK